MRGRDLNSVVREDGQLEEVGGVWSREKWKSISNDPQLERRMKVGVFFGLYKCVHVCSLCVCVCMNGHAYDYCIYLDACMCICSYTCTHV